MTVDPLASKYPDLSPYNFVGNSPIIAVDPNGKEIVISVTQAENGGIKITITIDAKVINESSKTYTDEELQAYADRMKTGVEEYFSQNAGSFMKSLTGTITDNTGKQIEGPYKVAATANISVAKSQEEINEKDHVIHIVIPGKIPDPKSSTDYAGSGVNGMSVDGSKFVYVTTDVLDNKVDPNDAEQVRMGVVIDNNTSPPDFKTSLERLIAHELGHNMGLVSKALGHDNAWFNNVMTQSNQAREAGDRVGTKFNAKQLIKIANEYFNGNTNSGSQSEVKPKDN